MTRIPSPADDYEPPPGDNAPAEPTHIEKILVEAGRLFRAGNPAAGRELLDQANAASLAATAETLLLIAGYLAQVEIRLNQMRPNLIAMRRALSAIAKPFLEDKPERL